MTVHLVDFSFDPSHPNSSFAFWVRTLHAWRYYGHSDHSILPILFTPARGQCVEVVTPQAFWQTWTPVQTLRSNTALQLRFTSSEPVVFPRTWWSFYFSFCTWADYASSKFCSFHTTKLVITATPSRQMGTGSDSFCRLHTPSCVSLHWGHIHVTEGMGSGPHFGGDKFWGWCVTDDDDDDDRRLTWLFDGIHHYL